MRPLPPPPRLADLSPNQLQELVLRLGDPELRQFISLANREYYHWEEVRRRPPPSGFSHELAWLAIKLSRQKQPRELPATDIGGRPFSYWLPHHAEQLLHTVDRIDGSTLAADLAANPNADQTKERLVVDSLMEEAIASSQIEGAVTTRRVAKDMLRSGRRPTNRSEQMILNGYQTIRYLQEHRAEPLSVELLHHIQSGITRGTLDHADQTGRFRTDEDQIHIVDARDNEVIFTPPPADQLASRLEKLIDFANRPPDADPFMHPLVKAIFLHYWFAYEHPYCDGNGRTARALFYWSMLRDGYWLFEYLTISRIIHDAPRQYYLSFRYAEHDDNDFTYFLMYQLEVTRRALAQLHDRVREIAAEQRRARAFPISSAHHLNPRQRALLDHALHHPDQIYTFEWHQTLHNVNNQTARNDLLKLLELGLLTEIGTGRPREFIAAHDLADKLGLSSPH